MKQLGSIWSYFYTETDNEHLGDIVNGLRYMNFAGFAVTKPNKVKVLEYLDEPDPLCQKWGPATPLSRRQRASYRLQHGWRWFLYSPDGRGRCEGRSVCVFFCFGGGGAGRAICSILAYHGARKIYITDSLKAVPSPSSMTSTGEVFAPRRRVRPPYVRDFIRSACGCGP